MSASPSLSVAASTWARLCAELDRVYPREGLALPLAGLVPRRADHNPCARLRLEEIAEIVLAECVLVPPALQWNCQARVGVHPSADEAVNRELAALLARHPQLWPCGYLHSHPFARGGTLPSRGAGGDVEGHMLPLLARNRELGLEASFSFIACRSLADRGWELHGFALVDEGGAPALAALGAASVVEDRAPSVARLLRPGLGARVPERILLRRYRRALRRAGLRSRCDELLGGWLRVVVALAAGARAAFLVPPDFPRALPRCYVVDASGAVRELASARLRSLAPDAWLEVCREHC
jgi:hypothetical protein